MSLDGLDLASVLVLGGVLDVLVVRGSAEPHHIVGDGGGGGGGGGCVGERARACVCVCRCLRARKHTHIHTHIVRAR